MFLEAGDELEEKTWQCASHPYPSPLPLLVNHNKHGVSQETEVEEKKRNTCSILMPCQKKKEEEEEGTARMPVWWAGCCWQRWQRAMWGPCDDGWGWELDGLECDVRHFKSIGAMKAYTPTQQDGSVTTQLVPNVKRQLTEWWMSDQIIVTAGIHINKKETDKKNKAHFMSLF